MNGGGFASVCLLWCTVAFFDFIPFKRKKVTEVLNVVVKKCGSIMCVLC